MFLVILLAAGNNGTNELKEKNVGTLRDKVQPELNQRTSEKPKESKDQKND